jgi:methionyl-tRNA formyltransferase
VSDSSLKIIFAGTPEFAAIALEAISLTKHQIAAVYTQPDRASGRGLKVTESPVKTLAARLDLPVYQPETLKNEKEQEILRKFNADIMVVAAYGLILPKAVLSIPRYGCFNIHASLLPRWRGAAPIQHAILAGDKVTGITIMQMDEGLDTGDMLLKHAYALTEDETSQTLHDQLAKMGAESIVEALNQLTAGKLKPEKQDSSESTYAKKISKEDALINWSDSAENIERKIRAFTPWPVAFTIWQGQHLRIGAAKAVDDKSSSEKNTGRLLHAGTDGLLVGTSKGALQILKVQLPGGRMINAGDFYNANRSKLNINDKF